uniref:Neur_chan_LBD domain-containing protein n=1 Tax=Heterorhabditis bacteriophora TaxID=37862 RepID=A0A1I7WQM2_HETBA
MLYFYVLLFISPLGEQFSVWDVENLHNDPRCSVWTLDSVIVFTLLPKQPMSCSLVLHTTSIMTNYFKVGAKGLLTVSGHGIPLFCASYQS